jgi:excisionase family DNA binding protein
LSDQCNYTDTVSLVEIMAMELEPTPLAATRPRPGIRRLLSLTEAAELLGLSVASTRRLVGSGKLPAVRITRRIQVDIRDLDQLIGQSKDRSGW